MKLWQGRVNTIGEKVERIILDSQKKIIKEINKDMENIQASINEIKQTKEDANQIKEDIKEIVKIKESMNEIDRVREDIKGLKEMVLKLSDEISKNKKENLSESSSRLGQ